MQCDRARELLSAFGDGELAPNDRDAVAAHIQSCGSCNGILADDRRIARLLKRKGRISAPPALAARLRLSIANAEARDRSWTKTGAADRYMPRSSQRITHFGKRAAALALVCVLSALATGWIMTGAGQVDGLERDVINAHIRSLLQDSPVQVASSDRHQVRPWFAGRADFSPAVKDLDQDGFILVGGRLDYVDNRRVGAVVYQRRLHIINVFMWPSPTPADTVPRIAARNGYTMISWSRGGLAYWVVSDLNSDELQLLVRLL